MLLKKVNYEISSLSLFVLVSIVISVGISPKSVSASEENSVSVLFSELPSEIKEEAAKFGYDSDEFIFKYYDEKGDVTHKKTRAMAETVLSAMFITRTSWGNDIKYWNYRYKVLNVRNGYERTGFYEVYHKKDGNNHIYDRIYQYRTW